MIIAGRDPAGPASQPGSRHIHTSALARSGTLRGDMSTTTQSWQGQSEGDAQQPSLIGAVNGSPLDGAPTGSFVDTCRRCGSGMSPDQRYCVECGERRGKPRFTPGVVEASSSSSTAGAAPRVVRSKRMGSSSPTTPLSRASPRFSWRLASGFNRREQQFAGQLKATYRAARQWRWLICSVARSRHDRGDDLAVRVHGAGRERQHRLRLRRQVRKELQHQGVQVKCRGRVVQAGFLNEGDFFGSAQQSRFAGREDARR